VLKEEVKQNHSGSWTLPSQEEAGDIDHPALCQVSVNRNRNQAFWKKPATSSGVSLEFRLSKSLTLKNAAIAQR
jgi:hypothetical protein